MNTSARRIATMVAVATAALGVGATGAQAAPLPVGTLSDGTSIQQPAGEGTQIGNPPGLDGTQIGNPPGIEGTQIGNPPGIEGTQIGNPPGLQRAAL